MSATTPSWTTVAVGNTVSMSCSCTSYPSPTVLWQQYQPDNSSATWMNSSLATATPSSSTASTGVYTVTSTFPWNVGQNADGSAAYFRYWFRCYCFNTAYSTTYYTNSTLAEFLPTCTSLLSTLVANIVYFSLTSYLLYIFHYSWLNDASFLLCTGSVVELA